MNKLFVLNYDEQASERVSIQVTEEFTEEKALEFITSCDYGYPYHGKPSVIGAVRYIAVQCLYVAKIYGYGVEKLVAHFRGVKGSYPLDGSGGLELTFLTCSRFCIDPSKFDGTVGVINET